MPAMPPLHRYERLDALRGLAMLWMAAFHFSFDLNFYKLLPPQNFYNDPFWTLQRTAIVSLFLLCAGASQTLAHEAGQGARRFWRRWAQIAACALLVSAGSWFMFPRSWISFGVLHGMAVMLILARALSPLGPRWLAPLGVGAVLLPRFVQSPLFDNRWLNWTGLVTHKPVTEDYVPVLPWLGVMLIGLALGQWLLAHRREVMAGPLPRGLAPLAVLGRWPLSFYMVHQPVLIGLTVAATMLR
ncbi:DUF1624 domain-containing protein [Azohydromonas lata]|uniref:DUF1624 domain-containing protein n=1 Tax=Azohydromonas lata TaxID=45677 RepID=UPI00082DAADD